MRKSNKKVNADAEVYSIQTGDKFSPFSFFNSYDCGYRQSLHLYSALRETVPIIDAAISKLVRLSGGFYVHADDPAAEHELERIQKFISVNGTQMGLDSFITTYFEQLLTYGTAIGEIVTDGLGRPYALYNAPLDNIELRRNQNGIDVDIYTLASGTPRLVQYPELITMATLSPDAGALYGNSLLRGLPFISGTMMKIFDTIGTNWERLGNIRFAVTYKPQNDAMDKAYAKERAIQVAKEWSNAMSGGSVKDFVAVGDVQIKVIGSECTLPDSEIPIRQLLEQIVAKTGLPPFMLGLSWNSTERMSSQQADALTSELEAYRRLLTPTIEKICSTCLKLSGYASGVTVVWDDITMQDMVELSKAELYSAQAQKIIQEDGNE